MDMKAIEAMLPTAAMRTVEGLPYPRVASGKVREIFDTGDHYLMVATDRLSAFDVILPDGIPGKGIILTQISLFWFQETAGLIDNHLVADHDAALRAVLGGRDDLLGRSMLVRKLRPLPIEAVVRAYLSGSGWSHYMKTGNLFGQPVPAGLRQSEKLPVPMFTPTTKAKLGDHDEPLTPEQGAELLGHDTYERVRDVSLKLFALGSAFARKAGLILADTKFEFGRDEHGEVVLIDEILTPDSSRYWPEQDYEPGRPQHAFDKQYVRDYLETLDWDKTAPGPRLPTDVIDTTRARYLAALEKLIGA